MDIIERAFLYFDLGIRTREQRLSINKLANDMIKIKSITTMPLNTYSYYRSINTLMQYGIQKEMIARNKTAPASYMNTGAVLH